MVLLLGWLGACGASSVPAVVEEAHTAAIVNIVTVLPVAEDRYAFHIGFRAQPVQVLWGSLRPRKNLLFRYKQGKPHQRGQLRVWPLVTGSGLESRMQAGDRVIVLLGSPSRSGVRSVLRVEPVAAADDLLRLRGQIGGD